MKDTSTAGLLVLVVIVFGFQFILPGYLIYVFAQRGSGLGALAAFGFAIFISAVINKSLEKHL